MTRISRLSVVATLLAVLMSGLAAAQDRVPVMIGGQPDLDACGSLGAVTGLNPKGDNFLAVREGPAAAYQMIAKLRTGQHVYICDERNGWLGVVYSPDGGMDCGVASPVPKRRAYSGRCASGWVHSSFITVVAG